MHTHKKFEMYKLATMLLAEGTVTERKGKRIYFTNTSEILKNLFMETAKKLGYNPLIKDRKTIVIYSNSLAGQLLELCRSFRIKPIRKNNRVIFSEATFPKEIFKLPQKQLKELLKIYFSCEGGVVIGRDKRNDEVIVRVCHPNLLQQMKKLIKEVSIEAKVRGNGLIYIRKRSQIEKFAREIGFVKGVKAVRGEHRGVEKNKLLKFVIDRHSSVQTARQANRAEPHRGFR